MNLSTWLLVGLAACSQGQAEKQKQPPSDLSENPIIRGLQFSPDGKWLAAATNLTGRGGPTMIWNTNDWRTEVVLFEPKGGSHVSFSPDSTRLAYSTGDGHVGMIDTKSRQLSRKFQVSQGAVTCVVFTPDGTQFVTSGTDGTIRFWDVTTGERKRTVEDQKDELKSIAISRDGKLLLAASMKLVNLRDLVTGELRFSTTNGGEGASRVGFSHDGKFFYFASWTGHARTYETATKSLYFKQRGGIRCAAMTSDHCWLATSGWSNSAHVFAMNLEPQTAAQAERMRQLIGHFGSDDYDVREAASAEILKIGTLSPLIRRAMTSSDAEVRVRARGLFQQILAPEPSVQLGGHFEEVQAVCFSPDDKLLATGSRGGDVRVWSVPEFQLVKTLHSASK